MMFYIRYSGIIGIFGDKLPGCCIPNTSGAFISFKDIAVPTSVYFDKNYEKLKQIKIDNSKDPNNHFRTRKTII
jgi:Berberine and berberine like